MKFAHILRRYGARAAGAVAVAGASVSAMADAIALPDLTAQLTQAGTQVAGQASSQAGAVAPFVLIVAGIGLVFGIAKSCSRKSADSPSALPCRGNGTPSQRGRRFLMRRAPCSNLFLAGSCSLLLL